MAEKIRFQANTPIDLALENAEGCRVPSDYGDGYQIMYSTTDGRRAYFAPFVAAKIAAAKPGPGQLLRITKQERAGRKGFDWTVEKLGEKPNGTFILPKQQTGLASASACWMARSSGFRSARGRRTTGSSRWRGRT